jgi:hypothetical protein
MYLPKVLLTNKRDKEATIIEIIMIAISFDNKSMLSLLPLHDTTPRPVFQPPLDSSGLLW